MSDEEKEQYNMLMEDFKWQYQCFQITCGMDHSWNSLSIVKFPDQFERDIPIDSTKNHV